MPTSEPSVLKVSFPYNRAPQEYDPVRIHLAPEYIFLENTFSPLVEFSPQGQLVSGVARRFEWKGEEAHFQIRDDLKTADGYPITAKDAAFSLKRVLVLTGNTHGNLKDLLCKDRPIQSVADECPGITVRDNTLILKTGSERRDFLFPMLAAIDFAVIPQRSVDPKSLKIQDYRNTTGPYFVESAAPDGTIRLSANTSHYHYSREIPQKVVLVPSDNSRPTASLDDYAAGKVDFITTIDQARPQDVIDFGQKRTDSELHQTEKIRVFMWRYTNRGIREIKTQKRLSIAKSAQEALRTYLLSQSGYESTDQFFPVFGEGGLQEDQIKVLESIWKAVEPARDGKGLIVWTVRIGPKDPYEAHLKKALPGIEILEGKGSPGFIDFSKNPEKEPHIAISGQDTGFLEDIGLISYSINGGTFALGPDEGKAWLDRYMSNPDKKSRLTALRELHLQALIAPVTVPVAAAPYVALARKPWKIGLPRYFANNPLWLITRPSQGK